MKIALVTDGWHPQVSGVVTTLVNIKRELEAMGHGVTVISFECASKRIPCPSYSEIELAVFPFREVADALDSFKPDVIHITSEMGVGLAARRYCVKRRIPFTTAYHTRFPEYIRERYPVPLRVSYTYFRWFHNKAHRVLVPTKTIKRALERRRFRNLVLWERGVDTEQFKPRTEYKFKMPQCPRPVMLYVGRIAPEKNLEAFLSLDLPGTKVLVGDGPDMKRLSALYPKALFAGYKGGDELAEYYAYADVFVFPSLTDTYGIVLLEALASGTPVAAFPAPGPIDMIINGETGWLSRNLRDAIERARAVEQETCRKFALSLSWKACAESFLAHQQPIGQARFEKKRRFAARLVRPKELMLRLRKTAIMKRLASRRRKAV